MSDFAEMSAPGLLMIERLLPGPLERVWDYLIDPELRGKWFAAGVIEPQVGGRATFEFDHDEISDLPPPEKYKDDCTATLENRVTKYEPPRLLGFTWMEDEAPNSEVTITLTEEGENVRLRLVHERLDGAADATIGMFAGWHGHLDIMADLVNGREPRDFWEHHMKLEEVYRERLSS